MRTVQNLFIAINHQGQEVDIWRETDTEVNPAHIIKIEDIGVKGFVWEERSFERRPNDCYHLVKIFKATLVNGETVFVLERGFPKE